MVFSSGSEFLWTDPSVGTTPVDESVSGLLRVSEFSETLYPSEARGALFGGHMVIKIGRVCMLTELRFCYVDF